MEFIRRAYCIDCGKFVSNRSITFEQFCIMEDNGAETDCDDDNMYFNTDTICSVCVEEDKYYI